MTAPGIARGALAGYYPEPGLGHPLLAGAAFFDDFRWNTVVQPWAQTTITSAPTWTPQTASGAIGVRQIVTAGSANTGGVLRMGASATDIPDMPVAGTEFSSRVRITSTEANTVLWTGFSSATTTTPETANNVQFIGFRSVAGTLVGLCKTGAGGGSETTVPMGIGLSEWRNLGWSVVDTDGAGTLGVQFWRADTSDRRALRITRVGSPVTTTLPSGAMYLAALGLVTTTASARTAQIDFVSHCGRTAR